MDLEAIQLGTFPKITEVAPADVGYVGWEMWMWTANPAPNTYGPITRSASERGYTVTVTAQVSHVVWDMGNGDTVTCDKGTPWVSTKVRGEASPDCGYVYDHEGEYEITATSYWDINWSGIGETGSFEMDLVRGGTVRIAEVQVVTVAVGDE